ncbi:serine/threonine-protein kinase [Peribacillus sp. NPDC097198]|uniref:serine/threonine-protein kinase n=1 Tax=Peribacillus sp. NPDC097198 TaxID=3364397 RepID=UPI00381A515F
MLVIDSVVQLKLLKEIGGEGRNSKVYIASDPQLNAEVVVKKINKSKEFTNTKEYFNEAQMLYASSHPNIMGVRYASQDPENVYIVMDFYKNGSLNSLLAKRCLTIREIIKYSLEFLSGLNYMHSKFLVHFDIKPTNILINDAGKAVLTDFGLSKYLNENGFANPKKSYPLHVPPETYIHGRNSIFSDIYQSGLTIYRMCNGNDYFTKQLQELNITNSMELASAIANNAFPKKESFLPHIPIKLRAVIQKALSLEETSRYESVIEMMNDIALLEDNLDWVYNRVTNEHSEWVRDEVTHKSKIVLLSEGRSNWKTEGYRIRTLDGKKNKVTKWNTNGYPTKEKALKSLEKLLNL